MHSIHNMLQHSPEENIHGCTLVEYSQLHVGSSDCTTTARCSVFCKVVRWHPTLASLSHRLCVLCERDIQPVIVRTLTTSSPFDPPFITDGSGSSSSTRNRPRTRSTITRPHHFQLCGWGWSYVGGGGVDASDRFARHHRPSFPSVVHACTARAGFPRVGPPF